MLLFFTVIKSTVPSFNRRTHTFFSFIFFGFANFLFCSQISKNENWLLPQIQHESLANADVSKGILAFLFSYRQKCHFADTRMGTTIKAYITLYSAIGTIFVLKNE